MNKSQGRINRRDNAVSPVVAVMLIIALTIMLAAISAVAFIGYNIPEAAPILGISIKYSDDGYVIISHLNGEVLKEGEYKILINGVSQDVSGFGDFKPGSVFRLPIPAGIILKSVEVVYVGSGGDTLLALEEFNISIPEENTDIILSVAYLNGETEDYKLESEIRYDTGNFGLYTGDIYISKDGENIVIKASREYNLRPDEEYPSITLPNIKNRIVIDSDKNTAFGNYYEIVKGNSDFYLYIRTDGGLVLGVDDGTYFIMAVIGRSIRTTNQA